MSFHLLQFASFALLLVCTSSHASDDLFVNDVAARAVRSTSADANIEFFLRQTLTNLKLVMATGFPQFGLPSMDPLKAGDANVNHDRGTTHVRCQFKDLLLYGLSDFEIRQLKVSMSRMQFSLKLLFKKLTVRGWYNMTGTVALVFPLYGHGQFEADASNVVIEGTSSLRQHSSGRLSIRDMLLDMTVDKVKVHFHDLLGGGPLSGAANGVLNLFGKKIFESAKTKLLENLTVSLTKNLDSKLQTFDTSNF